MKGLLKFLVISVIALGALGMIFSLWIKTDHAKKQVTQLISETLTGQFGLEAQIAGLELSLPLTAKASTITFSDGKNNFLSIKDFHINILPSLLFFWEVNIWEISADELHLLKLPELNLPKKETTNNSNSFINPNIIIQEANIAKLILAPQLTNMEKEIVIKLNSTLAFYSQTRQLKFSALSNLVSPKELLGDNSLKIAGEYNINDDLFEIKTAKLQTDIISADAELLVNRSIDQISGKITYNSTILEKILPKELVGTESDMSGTVMISGSLNKPEISADGNIVLDLLQNDYLQFPPLSWSSELVLSGTDFDGTIKLNQGDLEAHGDIGRNENKLYLKNFKAIANNFIKIANLSFDTNSGVITGTVTVTDKTLKQSGTYFPCLASGSMDIAATFSSLDNKKQNLAIKGKLQQISSKFGNYGLIDLDINSLDLWNLKLSESKLILNSANFNNMHLRQLKLAAHSDNDSSISLKGTIFSKQPYNVDVSFATSLYAKDQEFVAKIHQLTGVMGYSRLKNSSDILLKLGQENSVEINDLKIGQGSVNINGSFAKDKIAGSVKMEAVPLKAFPTPLGHSVDGSINGKLTASGTLNSPSINGVLEIKGGKYTYKQYGIKLKDLAGKIVASGSDLSFSNLTAKDRFQNQLTASGNLSLGKEKKFNLTLDARKFHLVNTVSLQGEINGAVTIVGNRDLALATGKIFLGPMEIKIPEHFQKTIPELNIAEVVEADDNVIYLSKEDPYRFKLDIEVEAADRVYVRGRGVDTLLTGQLKVTGFVNDPKVYGTLKSVHGRYQEFGKVLNIKEGVLTFDGSIPPSPYLNIVGVAIEGGYEIRLILAGSIQKPEITIESTPDVGQEEALSMLLFGSKPESNSMFQNIQLADGLRRLSGHGGGLDPLGLGRKILRVDDINFKSDPDNPESTSVGIGKHLTDKVYFEVERGQQDGNTKTRIEIQITPKISIENVSEQKGNTSFGVKWRFDY